VADWNGFSAKALKGLIRGIDNKIAYRADRVEQDQKDIASLEAQRKELAEALAAIESEDDA
jgi:hypothetical protein